MSRIIYERVHDPRQAALRQRRQAVGLYLMTLAALSGISPAEYSHIEGCRRLPKPGQIDRVDAVLRNYERARSRILSGSARSAVSA